MESYRLKKNTLKLGKKIYSIQTEVENEYRFFQIKEHTILNIYENSVIRLNTTNSKYHCPSQDKSISSKWRIPNNIVYDCGDLFIAYRNKSEENPSNNKSLKHGFYSAKKRSYSYGENHKSVLRACIVASGKKKKTFYFLSNACSTTIIAFSKKEAEGYVKRLLTELQEKCKERIVTIQNSITGYKDELLDEMKTNQSIRQWSEMNFSDLMAESNVKIEIPKRDYNYDDDENYNEPKKQVEYLL